MGKAKLKCLFSATNPCKRAATSVVGARRGRGFPMPVCAEHAAAFKPDRRLSVFPL